MPLFDIATARSAEIKAAYQLAERLSESESFRELAEAASEAAALEQVVVGIADDPFDGEAYTLPELEDLHFFAQIYADSEEGHFTELDDATNGTPRQNGTFQCFIRRQVRESEDRTDAYNFFWDRVSAIASDVLISAEELDALTNRNRFRQVGRMIGPEFGSRKAEADQGAHIYALLTFAWGDTQQS